MLPLRYFTAILILLSGSLNNSFAYASIENAELKQRITTLVVSASQLPATANVVQMITLITPTRQLRQLCENPELSLAGNNRRLTGNKSVIARCGNQRRFIQIKVVAEGQWWVAAHSIKPSSIIEEGDLMLRSGTLDHQPNDLILDKGSIIGQVATRTLSTGQAITQSELRPTWLAVAGHEVEVIAQGKGFQIRTTGKALTNAAAHKALRVSMRNGQMINGTVNDDGTVSINLKE